MRERRPAHPSTRPHALAALAAAALLALAATWLTLHARLGDYPAEAGAAMRALLAGDVRSFLATMPAYGGSIALRAPFALLAGAHGSDEAVYRLGVVPCGLALAVLLAAVAWQRRDRPLVALLVLAVGMLNPMLRSALDNGHPEELLATALALGALLLALHDRPVGAGLLLGLAFVAKPWTAVAIGPVLLALDARRPRALLAALVPALAWTAFAQLLAPGGLTTTASGLRFGGAVGTPFELFWPLTHRAASGAYHVPQVVSAWSHAAIVGVGAALAIALWLHGGARRDRDPDRWLALLALAFLARCALDPADNLYYHLPFLTTLLVYEARERRLPLATLLSGAALWFVFDTVTNRGDRDLDAACYLAVVALTAAWLAWRAFGPARRAATRPLADTLATRSPA